MEPRSRNGTVHAAMYSCSALAEEEHQMGFLSMFGAALTTNSCMVPTEQMFATVEQSFVTVDPKAAERVYFVGEYSTICE